MFDATESALALTPDVTLVRSLPDGGAPVRIAINSLVITGDEPVLVDTGAATGRDEWWAQVEGAVDPEDVRWIFLTHDEPDHQGNLWEALDRCPRATLVTSWFMGRRMAADRMLPLDRCRWINDGERFRAGSRELVALRPPAYDAPTTRGVFDVTSGVYWASDCFGGAVPHQVDELGQLDRDVWEDAFRLFHRLISPWAVAIDPLRWRAAIGRVAGLDPLLIASCHGPTIRRRDIGRSLDLLGDLPGMPEAPQPGQAELEALLAQLAVA